MKRLVFACVLGLSVLGMMAIGAGTAGAQLRQTNLFIDDGTGKFISLVAPAGMTGAGLTLTLPLPPVSNPPMGFVNVGTATGQLPWWDPTGTGQWTRSTNLLWNNTTNALTLGAAGSAQGSIVLHDGAGTSFTGTIRTTGTLTSDRVYTFPDADGTLATTGNVVAFDVAGTQSSTNAANNLFDVTGNVVGSSKGAAVTSTGTVNATGMTLSATAGAGNTATGLSVSAAGGSTNNAINVTGGDVQMNTNSIKGVGTLTTSALAGAGVNKYAQSYQIVGDGASTEFAITNSLVTATSTIVITTEVSDEAVPAYYTAFLASRGAGTFTVHLSGVVANGKHVNLSYVVVN
jgi:hypothetical protein